MFYQWADVGQFVVKHAEPFVRYSMKNGANRNGCPKVRATLYVSADLLDQARDATFHLAGYPCA